MKRIAKLILGVVVAVIGLGVIGLVGINLYLQSGEVQDRIRVATERALGAPIAVKRTLFTPWSGLILSGLSMPDPSVPEAHMVEAPSFSLKFEFRPLLQKRFVISQIRLDSPKLTLRQDDDGRWVLHEEKTRPVEPREPREPRPERPPREPSDVPEFTVELKTFRVTQGSASFFDRRGRRIAMLEGLDIEGTVAPDGAVSGKAHIHAMEFAGQLHPKRLRADFVHEGDKVAVTDIKCALAGGSIRGEFHAVIPRKGGSPAFEFKSTVEDVSIPKLIAEAHGNDAGAEGTIAGNFRLEGDPTDAASLEGGGEFALADARMSPPEMIRQIGALLRVQELQMLDLQQAALRFAVRNERVAIEDLVLRTDNIQITAAGPVRFDGRMKIAARLLVNERIEKQLASIGAAGNFTPSEDANFKQLTFGVTGRLDRPQTDLLDRLAGFKIGNFGGMLRGLFQPPARKPEDSHD